MGRRSRNDIRNWIASTHILFRLYFVLLNVEDDTWLITESLVISLSSVWTAVKSIFVVLLTKPNNRPIIGRCWLSNGWYRIIGKLADNRCTSSKNSSVLLLCQYIANAESLLYLCNDASTVMAQWRVECWQCWCCSRLSLIFCRTCPAGLGLNVEMDSSCCRLFFSLIISCRQYNFSLTM